MINRHKPHIYFLPEDAPYSQIVNGFRVEIEKLANASQTMPPADGCRKVIDKYEKDYKSRLEKFPRCYVILLVDFDEQIERLAELSKAIEDFRERTFYLGIWSEPEQLKTALRHISYGELGSRLAKECLSGNYELWNHELLKHNSTELERMANILKPVFFNNP